MHIEEKDGVSFVRFSIFAGHDLAAVVSTRCGGVSTGEFASLNMSFSTGDAPEKIIENRRRYFRAVGVDTADYVGCNQVHGTTVVRVGHTDRGRGAEGKETAIPSCDGLITNEPQTALTMNFADCTPLLFYDPVRRAVGLAHGGWRGTAGNIVGVIVREMTENFGTKPADILAAIGPAIGPERFEVGPEVIEAFAALFMPEELKTLYTEKRDGKYLYDLWRTNELLMLRAGILPHHIERTDICTYTRNDLFYSYRREKGHTGRHMALMELK
ncbi:peptidoglycan editing factor PgeF [Colibacter massiliensis]|uniref:peptidoglycan editing factor PgeF n=1 Tax=Colibacter massiliensis TaxID=1852379 RepID=UPI002357E87C|nr:peptidoglycan editing factor PgeF [Colibacter massiliensis]